MRLQTIAIAATAMIFASSCWAAEVEWKLGSQVAASDVGTQMLEEFAKRVSERTDRRMEIEVIPLETIGLKYDDALRATRQGVVDAVHIYPYYMARDEPLLTAFMPHTVLIDREDNVEIADLQYEIAKDIYAKWDLVPVARTTLGGGSATQQIVCTKPVQTLDELRQVKLRHFDKIGIEAMSSLGVPTQTLPSSEVYLGLRTGVIDCTFYAAIYTKSQSLYEVAPYWADIGYSTVASPILILAREDKLNELPEDLKDVLTKIGEEMYGEQMEEWRAREQEKAAETFLKENGMTYLGFFPLADREKVRDAMLDAWRKQVETIGSEAVDIYENVSAAAVK